MRISRRADTSFECARLFALVADINAYKDFLPWCSDSHIDRDEGDTVWATLHISYHLFRTVMTTKNTMRPDESIVMDLCDGAQHLKSLHGEWRFDGGGDGCCVTLDMDIQFKGPLPEFVLRPIFDHIGGTLVDMFIQRAANGAANGR